MSTIEKNENESMILEILLQRGVLSPTIEKIIVGFSNKWGISAFKALMETHIVDDSQLADILSDKLGFPRLTRVKIMNVAKEILSLIPFDLALELAVFPFELTESQCLHVVFADPSSPNIIRNLEKLTGKKIEPFVGPHGEIIAAIQRQYPLDLQMPSILTTISKNKGAAL